MEEEIVDIRVEPNKKILQNLAIKVDKIMRREIEKGGMKPEFAEARILDIKTVGVQGDDESYKYPAEITIKKPKHVDGRAFEEQEFYDFLGELSTRITNEIKAINRVLYLTAT